MEEMSTSYMYDGKGNPGNLSLAVIQLMMGLRLKRLWRFLSSKQKKTFKTYKSKNMNKLFLSIATMLMMGVSAFAANNDEVVNQQALRAFKRDFANASNISWEQKETYTKATFSLNGQVLFAYYNTNGDLQAVVRNIVSDQLPINLLSELKNEYSDYWISDLFEIATDGQTTYYITLENSEKRIVLKSQGTSFWSVFSKEKKESI